MNLPKAVTRDRGFFGEAVLNLRIKAGLTQQKLAELVGVQQSWIAQIEAGLNKSPTLDTIVRIAEALGVAPGELLAEYEGPKSKARRRSKASA